MSTEDSGRWYPGKFAAKAIGRRSSVQASDGSPISAAAAQTQANPSAAPLRSKPDAMRRRSTMNSVASSTALSPQSSVPRTSMRANAYPRQPLGNCQLQIFGLKYPTATNPSLRVELDGDSRDYSDFNEFFEENFTIFDISTQGVYCFSAPYF